MALIYTEAGILHKAKKYYRQALSLERDKPDRMNIFAYFLIDKNPNINEGMELIAKALELRPENYSAFHSNELKCSLIII
jgi:Tfp pilus assembly protein PilF